MHLLSISPLLFLLCPLASANLARRGCNADNCLRALSGNSASASAYCSAYTTATQTATTGFPTYVPAECGPSRVSSACTCLVTPTSSPTPSACPTGQQVVQNPGFEGAGYPNGGDDNTLPPWVITHVTNSSGGGCVYRPNTYDDAYDANSSIFCYFGTTGGDDTVSQLIQLCPGVTYTLTAHIGFDDRSFSDPYSSDYDPYPYRNYFTFSFADQTVIPHQLGCINKNANCPPTSEVAGYRAVTGTVVGPASGQGMLVIKISSGAGTTPMDAALLDAVTMTPVTS